MNKYVKSPSFVLLCLLLLCSATHLTYAQADKDKPRIISAGGSITEILFALGLGGNLVGVDTSSLYPEEAIELPKVGYFRSLGAEGLMSLRPDIIIAAKGAGPSAALKQVNMLGVEVRTYDQDTYTLDAWKKLIIDLGDDYSKNIEATRLIEKVTQGLSLQDTQRRFKNEQLNAVALLSIGQRGPVAAGKNTVPSLLLTLAGINNLADTLDGYKPFSSELLATQKLDLVLIPSHVIAGLGGKEAVCENQIIKLAMSGGCNIHVMDPLLLMGFGTRLDQAVGQIIEQANKL
ncbi:MAG: iron complex transport system substrate-binding protein [Arenicella sp.]|jgi:iron complex transport system substrate-binding protein